MIAVQNLDIQIGGTPLLHDVGLTVRGGECVALIGPNGAGKSTLLRAMSGDLPPSSGEVLLDERPIRSWNRNRRARKLAVMPQDCQLSFSFRAIEVVMMGRIPYFQPADRRDDWQIARAALDRTGVGHLADRHYPKLSGGEKQRVQFARVLAQIWESEGAVLLLDEPTASLDLEFQHNTLLTARQWSSRGAAVVVVLHDLNLACRYADRLVLLDRGRVHSAGAPNKVLRRETIAEVFRVESRVQHQLGRPLCVITEGVL